MNGIVMDGNQKYQYQLCFLVYILLDLSRNKYRYIYSCVSGDIFICSLAISAEMA